MKKSMDTASMIARVIAPTAPGCRALRGRENASGWATADGICTRDRAIPTAAHNSDRRSSADTDASRWRSTHWKAPPCHGAHPNWTLSELTHGAAFDERQVLGPWLSRIFCDKIA
jgi:hypothetical protein